MHSDDCGVIVMATCTDIYIKVDVTMNGEEEDGEYEGHHHVHVYLTFYIKHQKQVLSSNLFFFFSYKHHGHIKRQYSTQQPAFSRR